MPSLPSLYAAHPHQRETLFLNKLALCEKIYDFSDPCAQLQQKEDKRAQLFDIADYISSQRGVFNENTYEPFIKMVCANIMRTLPIGTSTESFYDPEDDEPFLEPAWPHLQIVYDLLRRFVVSNETDSQAARQCITMEFVEGIVELFNSEDPRERDYLKTILHRIYGKVMPLREGIRRAIMNVFHRFVYEEERHNGIGELLEILGSIINGFAVPLREEHKLLLRKGLMALHVPASMAAYHVELSFCVTQFVEKDSELAGEIVQGLIRHWPTSHSRKEVLLLNEMEEILELARPEQLGDVVGALFRRIGRCIESTHFQVAERALFYWNNEKMMNVIMQYREAVMVGVIGALRRNVACHWNGNVLSLSCNVQRLLEELDEELYAKYNKLYEEESVETAVREAERLRRWRVVYKMAQIRAMERVRMKVRGNGETGEEEGEGVERWTENRRREDSRKRKLQAGAVEVEAL